MKIFLVIVSQFCLHQTPKYATFDSMPRWIFSPVFAVIISIGSLFLVLSLIQTDAQLKESASIVDEFSQEVDTLRARVEEKNLIAFEATSAASKERIIRDELLMQQPGEYVIQLPNLEEVAQQKNESVALAEAEAAQDEPKTPLEAWVRLLIR